MKVCRCITILTIKRFIYDYVFLLHQNFVIPWRCVAYVDVFRQVCRRTKGCAVLSSALSGHITCATSVLQDSITSPSLNGFPATVRTCGVGKLAPVRASSFICLRPCENIPLWQQSFFVVFSLSACIIPKCFVHLDTCLFSHCCRNVAQFQHYGLVTNKLQRFTTRFNTNIIQSPALFKPPTLTVNFFLSYRFRHMTLQKQKKIIGGKMFRSLKIISNWLSNPHSQPRDLSKITHCWDGNSACFVTVLQDAHTV